MSTLLKSSLTFAITIVISTLTACKLTPEAKVTATTVEGFVVNKYTHQPLPLVPVAVKSWHYTAFSGVWADSITSVLTDANGHYQLDFDATAKGTIYRADIKYSRLIFDLTDYSKYEYRSVTDGASLQTGQANKVDFEATPYVPVKIFLDTDKQGASLLNTYFQADESDKKGYFTGTILIDTARTIQHITATNTVNVVPNRAYFFTISRALVNCQSRYDCKTTYLNFTQLKRYIPYTDTSIVHMR